ncbi:SDR family NAD(P)-dependent oxidoreductase [Saccharopolyspora erythraea]|uniref:SDR family NAD(P)-dependent oxidoreductase n=1 Tax=Saccharopolyspora erythraea TaxID=1836 RepID=UPI0004951B9D|nr:SDR family NAD(P)-dependent oxidoreductase [Saccharopolyspora erythraea]
MEVDLSEVNTLRKVIDFIAVADLPESGGTPSAVSEEVPTRPAYTPVLERELETVTHRYLPVAVERPPAASAEPDFSLSGKGVVVIADRSGQVCRELLPRLTDAGARTRVISSAGAGIDGATEVDLSDPQRLEAALAAARDELEQVQVVINLYQLAGASEGESTLDAPVESWTREVDTRMAVELLTAKACYPGLAAAGSDGGYFAATAVGGCFGLESASALDPLGGLTSGFVKSLALELPEMKAKVVDFTEQEPQAVAHALFDEIVTTTEPNVEVAYTDGTRKIVLVMPQELEHNDLQEPLRLDSDDVVVVSGGSRGITYECAKELVAAYGATVVILGRTPMPGGDEEWLGLDDDELSSYRADYMRRAKKENPSLTPAEVNAEFGRLLNRRSLYQNLVALRAYNPQVSYEECDVADAGQVAEAMERIRLRHGRITGVLHGAGLQSLRTADKKDLEHSLDLVRIKVNGAYNLWRAVSADEPRFVALVGSILGRIGMDGQVDYTAAADVMPKMSAQMARILPGSRMFTIAWTAWVGTGMATDDSVRKVQEGQRGMSFVGIEEGVQTLVRELSYGGFDPETFISGDIGTNSWGGMDAALDEEKARIATPVGPTGHVADRLNHPLLDEVHHRGDSSVHAAKRLRGDVDLYLEDHAVRGAGTFPAVFHVEAHAEASGLAVPGGSLVAAEDVELLRFVKDNPKFPLTLSVRAEVSDDGGDRTQVSAEIRSDLVGPGGRVLEADRLHSRGRYWFAEQAPAAGEPAVSVPELLADGREMDLESFYERTSRHLLFGPTFRHVRSVRSTGDSSVVGEIVVPHNRGLFSFGTSPRFSAMPTVIDNAWRAPLMWIYEETGRFCVPVSIGTMRFHRSPLPTERVYAFSRVTRMETSAEVPIHVDTQIIDDAGRLLCDITDLVLTKVAEDAVEPRR